VVANNFHTVLIALVFETNFVLRGKMLNTTEQNNLVIVKMVNAC